MKSGLVYPPGLIGLACGEIGRYSDFTPSIVALAKPAGTKFMKAVGLGPASPFNTIGRAFMDDPKLEWLFLTNDDQLYPVSTIYELLSCNRDVITGLYFGRTQPFEPIIFDSIEVKDGRRWYNRHLMQKGESGQIKVVACGDGCLLIRRRVMEAIPDPWWEYGETLTDACDHDVVFSRKVREAGFEIWCDTDVCVDHIAPFAVRPVLDKSTGEWEVHLVQANGRAIALPAAHGKYMEGRR